MKKMNRIKKYTLYLLSLALLLSCTIKRQETKTEIEIKETKESSNTLVCGGYTTYRVLSSEEEKLFRDTYNGELQLEPFEVATQVVAGINYRFRCKEKGSEFIYTVVIYKPLSGQGEAKTTSIKKEI